MSISNVGGEKHKRDTASKGCIRNRAELPGRTRFWFAYSGFTSSLRCIRSGDPGGHDPAKEVLSFSLAGRTNRNSIGRSRIRSRSRSRSRRLNLRLAFAAPLVCVGLLGGALHLFRTARSGIGGHRLLRRVLKGDLTGSGVANFRHKNPGLRINAALRRNELRRNILDRLRRISDRCLVRRP